MVKPSFLNFTSDIDNISKKPHPITFVSSVFLTSPVISDVTSPIFTAIFRYLLLVNQ
jgi:hypothetical protein